MGKNNLDSAPHTFITDSWAEKVLELSLIKPQSPSSLKSIQFQLIFIADPGGIEKVDEQKQCFGENQEKPTSEEKSATMRVGEQVPTGATFSKYHCESPSSTYFPSVALIDCWNSLPPS